MPPTTQMLTSHGAKELSAENYDFLRLYVHRESGIEIGADKRYLIESRLLPVVSTEQLGSLDNLCRKLRGMPSESLLRKVIESMTTHETFFFRDSNVFAALQNLLIPELVKQRKPTRTLRVWSAACSSGQEAYSVAMLLDEAGCGEWIVQILGTDLSGKILDRANGGSFSQLEVNRGLPARLLVKYFDRSGLDWRVKDSVRRMVRFAPFDLRQNMSGLGPFDLVLCRNVLIYFDTDTRRRILQGIRRALAPGGYLLLGGSETTFGIDESFERLTMGGALVYRAPALGGRQ